MKKDYDLLGIKEDSTKNEIKKAYIAKIKQFHPDVFQGDKTLAENLCAEINLAYEQILKNYVPAKTESFEKEETEEKNKNKFNDCDKLKNNIDKLKNNIDILKNNIDKMKNFVKKPEKTCKSKKNNKNNNKFDLNIKKNNKNKIFNKPFEEENENKCSDNVKVCSNKSRTYITKNNSSINCPKVKKEKQLIAIIKTDKQKVANKNMAVAVAVLSCLFVFAIIFLLI
ncbi:MAG: J domain-containing protein [Clostridia bacterium]